VIAERASARATARTLMTEMTIENAYAQVP
jgi:hypothetical protein